MAKLAGHNAKDGLSQHGILGFGTENTTENTTTNNENDASKTASTTSTGSNPGRSRWGNLIHVSYGHKFLLHWIQISGFVFYWQFPWIEHILEGSALIGFW